MTIEEYRKKWIDTCHNADCDELIALIPLPTEEDFRLLNDVLDEYKKKRENNNVQRN